jgi:xylulokinase
MKAYLGLDIGGTGAKAGVFDPEGRLIGAGHATYLPAIREEGHIELPIETVYAAARQAVRQAVAARPVHLAAMAIASQGQTFVSLDDEDRPLHDAILWYDSRAAAQSERLKQAVPDHGPHVPRIETIATAPKILWLHEHLPAVMKRARRYLLLPDYIAYRLTGVAATDSNTASSTGLFAEDAPDYHEPALRAAGIRREQMARIVAPGCPVAPVKAEAAAEWGLAPDTLLVAGTNDQYAGALGAGNCRPGILTETSGTCLAMVTLTARLRRPLPDGLFGGRFPIRQYEFAMAYSKTAGVVLDWFRREMAPGMSFDDLNAAAAGVPVGSRGVMMSPHFDGRVSPVPDAGARGAFFNLTLHHTRADLYRSVLEALSYSLRENVAFLRRCGLSFETIRSIGGGAKNDFWLQMKADVLGRPVEKPAVVEASTLGAAMLAALGHGAFDSLAAASAALYRVGAVFEPDAARHAAYDAPFERYCALGVKTSR